MQGNKWCKVHRRKHDKTSKLGNIVTIECFASHENESTGQTNSGLEVTMVEALFQMN
jgi:hypothetical protein